MINISGIQLKKDHRDKLWDYHKNLKKFGVVPPPLPKTLGRTLQPSMNQLGTFLCPGFSTALAGQYRTNTPMSPEWQAGKVSEEVGSTIAHTGADPREAMKAAVVWGHCSRAIVPFTLAEKGEDFVAEWSNYTTAMDTAALPNHPGNYKPISPDGGDMFDAIRGAMWAEWCALGDKASTVLMGTEWFNAFNSQEKYIKSVDMTVANHMYNAVDFDTIDGVDYLIIQSSTGDPSSIKYFSRDVVNRLYQTSGAFCAIFTMDDRYRGNVVKETLLKMMYRLLNYLHEIVK